jgi:macrophage erythroblast attacher
MLVDIDLFLSSKEIEEALQRGSCVECLQWCNDHKHRLKKMKSTLEFELRLQEYIELVRSRRLEDAIQYAKRHLMLWTTEPHVKLIQQAMALLAFPSDTICTPYKELYDRKRWQMLVEHYRQENLALHSLTPQSLLSVTLQAGLAALKTPLCRRDISSDCPVCVEPVWELAKVLPFSHQTVSCIICFRDREMMDENNAPLILPNGHVYCQKCIKQLSSEEHGWITCPRTKERFQSNTIKKIYVS